MKLPFFGGMSFGISNLLDLDVIVPYEVWCHCHLGFEAYIEGFGILLVNMGLELCFH
jgi:hypothetical protein